MKEYMLIFRHAPIEDFKPPINQDSAGVNPWQKWIGEIAAQVKFVSTNRLGYEGAIINSELKIMEGFYQDSTTKELISGNMIIKSDSFEEALELAQGCPILSMGGSVEVRILSQ
ncbi:MAG: YciI family protein [Parasphingorhabdus sp.]